MANDECEDAPARGRRRDQHAQGHRSAEGADIEGDELVDVELCMSMGGITKMNSTDINRKFIVKQLDDALRKCERKNIPSETVVETIISFGVTLAITFQTPEDAAKLLENMALAIRRGEITSS